MVFRHLRCFIVVAGESELYGRRREAESRAASYQPRHSADQKRDVVPLAVMRRRNDCNPALAVFIDTARIEAERRT